MQCAVSEEPMCMRLKLQGGIGPHAASAATERTVDHGEGSELLLQETLLPDHVSMHSVHSGHALILGGNKRA